MPDGDKTAPEHKAGGKIKHDEKINPAPDAAWKRHNQGKKLLKQELDGLKAQHPHGTGNGKTGPKQHHEPITVDTSSPLGGLRPGKVVADPPKEKVKQKVGGSKATMHHGQ